MEAVVGRGNLMLAYQWVVRNKGAAGVDGIGIAAFKGHLQRHWPTIKVSLLAGKYIPQPVRRVDIAKPQGGVRTLGIPTLTDRLIQQALHQVLSPIFEADFSASSYGFRPGRNAHQAVKAAKQYVAERRRVRRIGAPRGGLWAAGACPPKREAVAAGYQAMRCSTS
jgi:retron-type reverse transcriptase